MEILELSQHSSNQFINDLNNESLNSDHFFDYNIHLDNTYKKRADELKNRYFQREELAGYLKRYATRFSAHDKKTLSNIEKLKHPNSVVVIGGQQAGLLTGPLYTIHKIISIIVLAKQQEEELGIPVVPVFWVAGEDHDFAEINHVYTVKEQLIKKLPIKDSPLKKNSVSQLPINKLKTLEWIEQVFETFGETDFTNYLLDHLTNCVKQASTYVDMFELIIMDLFRDQGLVIINSGDPELRQLEKQYFLSVIEHNTELYNAVKTQQEIMREQSYKPIIEMAENSSNLFYHHQGERFLIERKTNDQFIVPDIGLTFSKKELIELIHTSPERFSNNVVSRPLMQEFLFPTLAFIAGPGELTYWAELKLAFEIMNIKMPPVLPRITITLLERSIERNIQEAGLTIEEVLENGVEKSVEAFLKNVSPIDMEPLIKEAKREMSQIHNKLINAALKIDNSLEPMLKKNGAFIQEQLDFLHRSVEKRKRFQHEVQLSKYQAIERALTPNSTPQERIWNIYYYLNKFGPDFVGELIKLSYSFNGKHKIVKI